MKNNRLLTLTSVALIIASCSPVKVHTRYNTSIDFTQYETWCWLQGCELQYEGPFYLNDTAMFENIGNIIALEMQEKGFTQQDENPDLLLDFHIIVKEDSAVFARVHEENLPYWSDYQEKYYHFLRGSLVIDIIDRSKGQVIWQSNAESYMSLYPDIDQKSLKKGIKKTLKKFPPEN